jgi:mucin-19
LTAGSNYDLTYAGANVIITKRDASVAPNASSKTYGDTDPAPSGTVSGFLAADGVAATYSRTAGETVAGSPYTISATLSTAAALGNYNIDYKTASFTINKKDASVTPSAGSKTYGDTDPPLSGTVSGFVAADGVTATYSRTAGETVAGSPYTISATLSPAAALGNYSIDYKTASFTITPAPLTVTPDDVTKTYGQPATLTGKITGQKSSEIFTATYASDGAAATAPVGTGSYPITVAEVTGTTSANYTVVKIVGTLTVTKAPLSIKADNQTRLYGQADPTLAGAISGLQNGDAITATYNSAATAVSPVGNYDVVPAAVDSTPAKLANYSVTLTNGTLTVTKAALSVKASDATRTYGEANPAFSGDVTGAQNGDNITATYASAATAASPVGTYPIVPALSDPANKLGNYDVSSTNGTLTVSQAVLTVTPDNLTKAYGQAATLTGVINGQQNGETFTTTYASAGAPATAPVNGSPYDITVETVTGATIANYTVATNLGKLTVNRADQTIAFAQPASPATYNTTFAVAPTASSGLSVTAAVSGACSISNGAVTMTSGSGTCTLTASQAGDTNYNAATNVTRTVDAQKASQTITLTGAPTTAVYNTTFSVTASASSGLTVSLAASGACSISGNTVTMSNGTGACALTADQAGDADYSSAPQAAQSTTAQKAVPSVIFTGAPATGNYQSTFTVAATTNATSTAAIAASGACSISGATVTITSGTGTCSLAANWAEDAKYLAASATQSTTAQKAPATISLSNLSQTYDGTPKSVTATATAGGVNTASLSGVSITYNGSATAPINAGSYNTVASLTNDNYAAPNATGTLVIAKGTTTITWSNPANMVYGTPLSPAQLSAAASVPGTFVYTPAAGTILGPGSGQVLSVTFAPTDTTDYAVSNKTVTINVLYSTGVCDGDLGHTILQPINATGTMSVFKAGSTVPTKFRVCDANGASVGTPGLVKYYQLVVAGSNNNLTVDETAFSNTPDTAFRWDPTAQQWIFNQATGKNTNLNQTGMIYVFSITLNDGSVIQFQYGLK